jgi:hypothetical protein
MQQLSEGERELALRAHHCEFLLNGPSGDPMCWEAELASSGPRPFNGMGRQRLLEHVLKSVEFLVGIGPAQESIP